MQINEISAIVREAQRGFHETIAASLATIHDSGSWAAALTLVSAGFLYGVFHAVGPGHGKVVVGGYMLADDVTLRRGIAITLLSSLLQAIVAVLLVLIVYFGFGLARAQTEYAAAWLETASYALIGAVGAFLILRGFRGVGMHAHHAQGACCDHAHTPDGETVKALRGRREMFAMVLSIGIRPCSGAILMMLFACLVSEITAGIAATFAMAIGTAITTSAIAVAAATSRKGLLAVVGRSGQRVAKISAIVKISGGVIILGFAAFMLFSTLPQGQQRGVIAPYHHPLVGRRG